MSDRINLFLVLALICVPLDHFGQMQPGEPLSYRNNLDGKPFVVKTYELKKIIDVDSEKLRIKQLHDSLQLFNLSNGFGINVKINVRSIGALNKLRDGSKLYLLKIGLREALGMRVIFSQFKIPAGSRLFFYNTERTTKWGAYTELNNHHVGDFATAQINGDTVIIEYFEPNNPEFDGILEISTLVYIFAINVPDLKGIENICKIDMMGTSCHRPLSIKKGAATFVNEQFLPESFLHTFLSAFLGGAKCLTKSGYIFDFLRTNLQLFLCPTLPSTPTLTVDTAKTLSLSLKSDTPEHRSPQLTHGNTS